MTSLVVASAFVPYPVGSVITDPTLVATILASENASHVLQTINSTGLPYISAPAVSGLTSGGVSLISGQFWNGTPGSVSYSLDGGAIVAATSASITGGFYTFQIATPAPGSHTMQVIGSGANPAASALTSFVTASSRSTGGATIVSGFVDGAGNTIVSLSDGSSVNLGALSGTVVPTSLPRLIDDRGYFLADDSGNHLVAG